MDEYADTWLVLEIQSNGDQLACISSSHTSWNDALSKFYQTMILLNLMNLRKKTLNLIGRVNKMALADLLNLSASGKKIGISEERLAAILPIAR